MSIILIIRAACASGWSTRRRSTVAAGTRPPWSGPCRSGASPTAARSASCSPTSRTLCRTRFTQRSATAPVTDFEEIDFAPAV